jgi:NAD-dependent deacetylase
VPPELVDMLRRARQAAWRILVLTGAGISAESGIATFRGKEGYWVVGSRNYMPQELATYRMFQAFPEQVWRWYLYRFGVCRLAEPNAAHRTLVDLEAAYGARFCLVTQNIDGLHRRAGSSIQRTFCIHGDAAWVRCSNQCGLGLQALPDINVRDIEDPLTLHEKQLLTCPKCAGWLRPHVLWFDECYDEENYRADSALRAAAQAELLIVVGTSGATSLPLRIGMLCQQSGAAIIDVNPEANPFSILAERAREGFVVRTSACDSLPQMVAELTG